MGVVRLVSLKKPKQTFTGKVSVIVPFRNEHMRMKPLLESLSKQQLQNVEFIFVDDHSQDSTAEVIHSFAFSNYCILPSNGSGKKSAIRTAVAKAKGEVLLFTDADCIVPSCWIEEMTLPFSAEGADLVAGPVSIKGRGWLTGIQYWDQIALVASSAGSGAMGMPFMCSGANLAVNAACYPCDSILEIGRASGDDVFLLHHLHREKKNIRFTWNKDACVLTLPESSWRAFFKQRMRWAGKASSYSNGMAVFVSLLVLFCSASLLFGGLLSAIHPSLLSTLLICLGLKAAFDFLFLLLSERGLGHSGRLHYFLPAFFFHVLYILPVAVLSQLVRAEWKNRKIN
ncbi:MAG TPA: hypothetical protein DEP18_02090 [Flavobacteriales bacterium]|nr:hypothetical protein [Flavobacteriales bacterium]